MVFRRNEADDGHQEGGMLAQIGEGRKIGIEAVDEGAKVVVEAARR